MLAASNPEPPGGYCIRYMCSGLVLLARSPRSPNCQLRERGANSIYVGSCIPAELRGYCPSASVKIEEIFIGRALIPHVTIRPTNSGRELPSTNSARNGVKSLRPVLPKVRLERLRRDAVFECRSRDVPDKRLMIDIRMVLPGDIQLTVPPRHRVRWRGHAMLHIEQGFSTGSLKAPHRQQNMLLP